MIVHEHRFDDSGIMSVHEHRFPLDIIEFWLQYTALLIKNRKDR